MKNLPDLSQLLAYENAAVISQFCFENLEITVEQAQQIFRDLLAWFWLSENRRGRQLQTHMLAPLATLDKMWHVFILHTKQYSEFCHHYFNYFLHHEVEPVGQEYKISAEELSAFLHECYDFLGEAWLLRNFERN